MTTRIHHLPPIILCVPVILALACEVGGVEIPVSFASATTTLTPTATSAPTAAPTPFPTPDLSRRPLVWFAPLPPLEVSGGRPFIGAEDYMDLFKPDAPWQEVMDRIDVFEVYGGWAAYAPWTVYASDAELRQVIDFVNQHGLALAMEDSPIAQPADCGAGIESYGGLGVNL